MIKKKRKRLERVSYSLHNCIRKELTNLKINLLSIFWIILIRDLKNELLRKTSLMFCGLIQYDTYYFYFYRNICSYIIEISAPKSSPSSVFNSSKIAVWRKWIVFRSPWLDVILQLHHFGGFIFQKYVSWEILKDIKNDNIKQPTFRLKITECSLPISFFIFPKKKSNNLLINTKKKEFLF